MLSGCTVLRLPVSKNTRGSIERADWRRTRSGLTEPQNDDSPGGIAAQTGAGQANETRGNVSQSAFLYFAGIAPREHELLSRTARLLIGQKGRTYETQT